MALSLGFDVVNISFENLRIKAARITLQQQLLFYLQACRTIKAQRKLTFDL